MAKCAYIKILNGAMPLHLEIKSRVLVFGRNSPVDDFSLGRLLKL